MPLQWMVDIPAELRVQTYKYFFQNTAVRCTLFEDCDVERANQPVEACNEAPLNLFLTAKLVKAEAEPLFWSLSLFQCNEDRDIGETAPDIKCFDKIQHLVLTTKRSFCSELTLQLALRRLQGPAEFPLHYLVAEVPFALRHHRPIQNIMSLAKNRVARLHLKLFSSTLTRWAALDGQAVPYWGDPLPLHPVREEVWKIVIQLIIRNTYNISVIGSWDLSKFDSTKLLREVHGDDFDALQISQK